MSACDVPDFERPGLIGRDWTHLREEYQEAPEGGWPVWVFLGGRGAGKTRTMAEWVRREVAAGTLGRVALVGPSYEAAREVMIEGPSGLIAVTPRRERPRYASSRHVLHWPNGAIGQAFSAEDPDALRGPQFHGAWGDEFCAWKRPQRVMDVLWPGLRLGALPRLAVSTTPRNIPALKKLIAMPGAIVSHGRTAEAAFLSEGFRAAMAALYAGTRLGAQELDGEIVEDRAGALWSYELLERARGTAPARLDRIVVAVDPPVSTGPDADGCGIVVAGAAGEGMGRRGYVLADASVQGASPDGWARAVVSAYEAWSADRVVAEVNQGGDLVARVLRGAAPGLPVKSVHATRGKAKRAEPVVALYERGAVAHCGVFAELEAEMRALGTDGRERDDRADALVWALTELMLGDVAEPRVRML
jgi:phage terminase large subunit-like protein